MWRNQYCWQIGDEYSTILHIYWQIYRGEPDFTHFSADSWDIWTDIWNWSDTFTAMSWTFFLTNVHKRFSPEHNARKHVVHNTTTPMNCCGRKGCIYDPKTDIISRGDMLRPKPHNKNQSIPVDGKDACMTQKQKSFPGATCCDQNHMTKILWWTLRIYWTGFRR